MIENGKGLRFVPEGDGKGQGITIVFRENFDLPGDIIAEPAEPATVEREVGRWGEGDRGVGVQWSRGGRRFNRQFGPS